jgi:8-amino-7-oxononanoate synthase
MTSHHTSSPVAEPAPGKSSSTATQKPVDLFQKCWSFTRADEIKAAGLYPYFRPIQENEGPVVQIEGRRIIMAGSNNYLGLTADPRVKEAARKAVEKYGTGCSGSRYLTGTLDIHVELEERLAAFFQREACLLYSTGFQTAQGIIPVLVQKGEFVVSDRDNHACIVAGQLIAKGAYADYVRYKHNDMADLERVVARLPHDAPKLVVSDGVFSTWGTIVDLPPMVAVARKHNARILIDDAHATGVIGKGGRGTASHFNLEKEVDMTMGTFSKTFSSLGGFVVADRPIINFLKHHAPALIFSASPTPAAVAAALAALDILEKEPFRMMRLLENAEKVRKGLRALGFNVVDGQTAIVPVIIGDDTTAFIFWRHLFEAGVFVNVFVSPGVPPGMAMLRTSFMATHEDHQLNRIIEAFGDAGKKMGIIS